jgi:hypothetical protein
VKNRLRAACFGLAVLVYLAGCAATPPPVEKREAAVASPAPPAGERVTTPRPAEDRDLFLEGIALLNLPGGPDPVKARAALAALIRRYPQSPWRPAAESVIRLIDENGAVLEVCLETHLREEVLQAEKSAAMRENESLQGLIRELQERRQTETATLIRENEKLKADLQRLKALEIELEKRERMLR